LVCLGERIGDWAAWRDEGGHSAGSATARVVKKAGNLWGTVGRDSMKI
jgi:hypothetical protein